MNSACVHDPFLTPFSDEVLDQIVGKEFYSFTDGFSGYLQVRIAEEDKKKTTLITERYKRSHRRNENLVETRSIPMKHRPYHLNPRIKEKVKKEVDKMLASGLVFPIEEAEWINPIVIQSKKDKEDFWFCVDYRSLNSACVHNPFLIPFSDEVLE